MMSRAGTTLIFRAANFAASRHAGQSRKGDEAHPYINHPLAVAEVLCVVGRITDPELLAAALLHDTVEDTDATFEELEREFGTRVKNLVAELTDDKSLPKEERKRLQVEHACGQGLQRARRDKYPAGRMVGRPAAGIP